VNRISVVIPSRMDRNLAACLQAVHELEPEARAIVVDDGLQRDRIAEDVRVPGVKPFIYSRNCNLGIQFAFPEDVVLLNDDALLRTARGFSLLRQAVEEHPEYGAVAAACNNVGNLNQHCLGTGGLREEPKVLCFICVYIPRRTFERIGLLDERFTSYGWEDNDFCRRVQNAGLKLGIHDGVFVDHGSLPSTFRGLGGPGGDIGPGRQIYLEKWGSL
jgi:hypothetical protein